MSDLLVFLILALIGGGLGYRTFIKHNEEGKMKQPKKLTRKHKKILSNKVGNIEGWKYIGIGERQEGAITRRIYEYRKIENGNIVDSAFELAD